MIVFNIPIIILVVSRSREVFGGGVSFKRAFIHNNRSADIVLYNIIIVYLTHRSII